MPGQFVKQLALIKRLADEIVASGCQNLLTLLIKGVGGHSNDGCLLAFGGSFDGPGGCPFLWGKDA